MMVMTFCSHIKSFQPFSYSSKKFCMLIGYSNNYIRKFFMKNYLTKNESIYSIYRLSNFVMVALVALLTAILENISN